MHMLHARPFFFYTHPAAGRQGSFAPSVSVPSFLCLPSVSKQQKRRQKKKGKKKGKKKRQGKFT
jgi:hypothetical protein